MPSRTLLANGMEFEVVFDGAHDGADRDLLAAERIPEKLSAESRATRTQQLVIDALRTRAPLTLRELSACTGLPLHTVNKHLHHLRIGGQLRSRDTDRRTPNGRQQREYWLRGAAVHEGRDQRG